MADASTFNFFQAMTNPQYAAQQLNIQRQQAIAQQLMEEGGQQQPTNQLANPGGQIVPISPAVAFGRALEKGLGGYMSGKALNAQMQGYQDLYNQQHPLNATAAGMVTGGESRMLTPEEASQARALGAQMGSGQNTAITSNDPTFMEMFNPNERLGNTMYENRMAGSKAAAVAGAEAPYKMVQLADGTQVPLSSLVSKQAQNVVNTAAPLPWTQSQNNTPVSPSSPPVPIVTNGKPEAPSNIMPNVIPGTTPGVPEVNPNSPEGAAKATGLKEAATEGAKSGSTYQDKLVEESSHAIEGKRIIEQMRENLKGFEPGKLANAKAQLSAWGQALGFDKNSLDADLGNVGDVQSFNKLTAQLAIQAIKQISPKATQMEFQRFLENNPNPELSPDAMNKLIDFTGKTFDLPLQKQQAWTKWKKSGNSLSDYADFDSEWNQNVGVNMPKTLALHQDSIKIPSADDIAHLKKNPSVADLFDKEFGSGTSQKYLTPTQQGFQ